MKEAVSNRERAANGEVAVDAIEYSASCSRLHRDDVGT